MHQPGLGVRDSGLAELIQVQLAAMGTWFSEGMGGSSPEYRTPSTEWYA